MIEEWRDVEGFEGFYQVSNLGRVRSLDRIVPYPNSRYVNGVGKREFLGKILKLNTNKHGYLQVTLRKNGIQTTHKVHQLVAIAFLKKPDFRCVVNHKNSKRDDNQVDNLEWCTQQQNLMHAAEKGAMSRFENSHNNTTITKETVLQIRKLYEGGQKIITIANSYNLKHNHVESIVKRRTWRHL